MKKQTYFAILIAAALILSGCSLNTVDKIADNNQVILKVGDRTLVKSDVASQVYEMQQTYYLYQQYGMVSQVPDTSAILSSVISSSTDRFVLLNKAEELGLEITEEELSAITATAQEQYDAMIDQVGSTFITSGATGDKLREEAVAYAEAHDLGTLEEYVTAGKESKLLEKITDYTHKDVNVTDEDLQAKLDELASANKATYDADPASYGTAVNNGTTVYYAPEGYRYVKHILIKFAEEDAAAVTAASSALTTAKTAAETASTALADAQAALENAAAEADKTPLHDAVAAAQTALDTANADLAAAQAAYDEAAAAAAVNIQAKADEVYALVTAEGADFDALMAEYGEDPGMTRDPAKTNGYAICSTSAYVPQFLEASMALANVGDISGEVVTEYGIHIIKYEAEIPAGTVALETVRDALTETVKSEKQNAAYEAALTEWKTAADIKSYPDRMGY